MTRRLPRDHRRLLSAVVAAVLLFGLGGPGSLPSGGTPAARAAVRTPLSVALSQAVAPAVAHTQGQFTTDAGTQAAHLLRVDPRAEGIRIESLLSNDVVVGLETTSSQARRASRDGHRVVAAINASVWGLTAAVKAPAGLNVLGGELVSGATSAKVAFGVRPDGSLRVGAPILTTTASLPGGATLAIDRVNRERPAETTVLYTPRWGPSTQTAAGGVEVVLDAPGAVLGTASTVSMTVREVRPAGANTPVARDRFVLSADGADEPVLAGLQPGASVTITTAASPGWIDVVHAVGGREWIIRRGAISISPRPASADERHPRTAVGLTADGQLVAIVVDGRQPGYSAGVTLPELGEMLLAQGVVDAINLDGGGSSTFLAREPGAIEASLRNRPSDGRERAVMNALAIVSTIPTGPLAEIVVAPPGASLIDGAGRTFEARARDAALNGIPVDPAGVTWTVDGPGTIDGAGRYRTAGPGTATVIATYGGIAGRAPVTVAADTFAPSVSLPAARLVAPATLAGTGVPVTVAWSATDVGRGVARYRLRKSENGGAFVDVPLASLLAKETTLRLAAGRTYQFAIQAIDAAGNASAWRKGSRFRPRLIADSSTAVRWAGRWTTVSGADYLDGRTRYSRVAASTARLAFTGSEIAWVAAVGPTRGQARLYVDGVHVRTVDLRAATTTTRRLVFRHAFASSGSHRIEVRVVGTAGRPRVDVDAFAILAPPP